VFGPKPSLLGYRTDAAAFFAATKGLHFLGNRATLKLHISTKGTPVTQTTQATINDDKYSIERSVLIDANPERVWAAITTPELITEWFGQRADLPDLSVGATGSLGWDGYGDFPILISVVDKPRVFAYRWVNAPGEIVADDNSTLVTFTLEADGEQTILTVVETGFDVMHPDEAGRTKHLHENQGGWNEELDELVAFFAGGSE
jgi:uncharacterized protein YndB with AHSA1/START domain